MRFNSNTLPLLTLFVPLLSRAAPGIDLVVPLVKRTSLVDSNGVVNPQSLDSQIARVQDKLQRGFSAFQKNTGTVHPSDTEHIGKARRATGSDALTDDQGELWQGAISVGTPPVQFTVDFDTGSSDLFLPGVNCNVNCQGHTAYDTDTSSTAKDQGRTFQLAFGDGSTVEGEIFTDVVSIAGLTATNQTVGSSTQYSTGFAIDQFPPDGLMGMAFPQISEFGSNPVFQTLVAQGKASSPEFTFKLNTSGSSLFLGGVDSNLFTGIFTKVPVTQVGFWQVDLASVNVAGKSVVTGLSAIVDTGTTLVLGDSNSVATLYAAIPGSKNASANVGDGFFTVPCDSIPNISLTFGNTAFSISASTFNLGLVSQGSSDCVGGIAAADLGDFWIVGDVFLQNVLTSFNVGTEQVGFATLS